MTRRSISRVLCVPRCSRVSRARRLLWGDAQPRENAASMFYTRQVQTSGRHVVEQALDLAQAVIREPANTFVGPALIAGAARLGRVRHGPVEFPMDADSEKKIGALTANMRFAILNPGAGWGAKQWPVERYGVVARSWRAMGSGRSSIMVREKKNLPGPSRGPVRRRAEGFVFDC